MFSYMMIGDGEVYTSFPPPAAAPDELDEPEDVKEQAEGKMALSASQKAGRDPSFQISSSNTPQAPGWVSAGSSTHSTLKVTLLGSEWSSSKGGVSTLNRELAIHLAEDPKLEVTLLVPEGACTEKEKREAKSYKVTIVDAKFQPGYDPLYWLSFPPEDLSIDIVVGHGAKLGAPAQIIRNVLQRKNCKWVQVVHTAPEDLGRYKRYTNSTSKGENKHHLEVELCKRADIVVSVGSWLANVYSTYLRRWKEGKDIFTLTPGLFEREFGDLVHLVKQAVGKIAIFKVLMVGRCDEEDFEVKGYNIAAVAFTDHRLRNKPYELIVVGAPEGKQDKVKKELLKYGIVAGQLTVRKFVNSRDEVKTLFAEVNLVIMPSNSEGFGLVALEALSAGLPILVSRKSGFAKALEEVSSERTCVMHSDDPAKWAEAIAEVHAGYEIRLKEIKDLKTSYGKMYSWKKQCEALVERMREVNQDRSWSTRYSPDDKHKADTNSEEGPSVLKRENTEPSFGITVNRGYEKVCLRIYVSHQEQSEKKQEEINKILKKIIIVYTKSHDLSSPNGLRAFVEHLTQAYNLAVVSVEEGSLVLTVRCPNLESLERLWNDYQSGCLNDIVEVLLLTNDIKSELNLDNARFKIAIGKENYLMCKKALSEKSRRHQEFQRRLEEYQRKMEEKRSHITQEFRRRLKGDEYFLQGMWLSSLN